MNNSYLTNIMYNAGIYIRLSQEDKDKKYGSGSSYLISVAKRKWSIKRRNTSSEGNLKVIIKAIMEIN